MPATDALAPPMQNDAERAIVKAMGGWTAFCLAYGLKPFNPDENEEAVQILREMAREEMENARSERR